MQVKNMLKNLFVSGVLVLSSGTVYNKQVDACMFRPELCFLDARNGARFDGDDSLCFDISAVQACLEKEAKCFADLFFAGVD